IKPNQARMIIVAIDAGHGGKDPGAPGPNGAKEKDITLAISKKLTEKINKEPNMRAFLTRDGDYYMSLPMRRAKARRMNADLFVSVHADAAHRKSARGSSVYTLSQRGATSTMASWLAKKENSVDNNLMGGIDLVSKSSDIKEILIDLSINATINDSTALAQHVLNEIGSINQLHKKHVERAPFAVLKSPDIPSILVETAFLSNPEDEKKLKTESFQTKMAKAMLNGIKSYLANSPAMSRAIAQVD
ncbi:MAG: N-acetylmuramoyl-L-alanine amidase, partial [Nitrosomonas sp.]|nr:N-acetylmuramoyl-L-alanine amidase [Nitrosomonas sp.]